jgi:ABC-type transport system substrate-binding protein
MNEDATRLAALRAGDVDIECMAPSTKINMVKDDPSIVVPMVASASYLNLAMDVRIEPPNNKLVRKAFQYATDREMINQAVFFEYGTNATISVDVEDFLHAVTFNRSPTLNVFLQHSQCSTIDGKHSPATMFKLLSYRLY